MPNFKPRQRVQIMIRPANIESLDVRRMVWAGIEWREPTDQFGTVKRSVKQRGAYALTEYRVLVLLDGDSDETELEEWELKVVNPETQTKVQSGEDKSKFQTAKDKLEMRRRNINNIRSHFADNDKE